MKIIDANNEFTKTTFYSVKSSSVSLEIRLHNRTSIQKGGNV